MIQGLESDLKPYGQKSIGRTIRITVEENADAGMAYYYQLKNDKKDSYNFESEGELNKLGYRLLNSGKIIAAIKIFKLNATEFPNSSNVYDSLGDAYYANKELKLAKENFKKSLKLNPANEHAKEMLKKKR
ncbi:MAG: tetratricopeptide repeat protein [Saprospiraceae bacterium]|nr:tetratricopeptide repeat protein [Candidatus Brachybacter algidus]